MQTCTEVGDCVIKACAPKFEKDCHTKCLAEGAAEPAAIAKAAPALSCMQSICLAKECTDTTAEPECLGECMNEQCLGSVLTCIDDGKTGDKPCATISECFDACGLDKPEPFKCMNACLNSLDAKAKEQAAGVAKCMNDNQDMDKCFLEVAACFTGGKTGDKPCGHLMQCMGKCDEGNKGEDDGGKCMFGCLSEVDADAQKIFAEIGQSGCFGGDEEGGDKQPPICGELMFKCALHNQSGDMKCADIYGCAAKCVADQEKGGGKADEGMCYMGCAGKLSKEAQGQFLALSKCRGKCEAGCAGDKEPDTCTGLCQMKDCAKELAACPPPKK